MRIPLAPVLLLFAISSRCLAAEAPPALLAAKLASLAGQKSVDCGPVALHENSASAMKCAKDASAAGTPYRVSFELESADSVVWQGAVQDAQGKHWILFYDSGSRSGDGSGPTFSAVPCKTLRFVDKGGEFLDCEPSGEG